MAKPFAVLLLLLGMWGAELSLFGLWWAGALAITMWIACAGVLIATREQRVREPVAARSRAATARRAHVLG